MNRYFLILKGPRKVRHGMKLSTRSLVHFLRTKQGITTILYRMRNSVSLLVIIIKLKCDEDMKPARFIACLVVTRIVRNDIGNRSELVAPVVCMEDVRIMFAVSVSNDWSIHQLDIKGAFLHASLSHSDDICVCLPSISGLNMPHGNNVRLFKSLHGVLQAPLRWFLYFCTTVS